MDQETLIDLICFGSEERNLEYKGTMPWNDSQTKAKVTKSVLAMANIPDGGSIIFGVSETNPNVWQPNGMDIIHARSFNQDDVQEYVNQYADPYVEIKVTPVSHNEMMFVVIQVKEFNEIPVVCKKDGLEGLKRGGVYTRPRRKIESVLIPTQNEMREILDLATDKQIRMLLKKLSKFRSPTLDEILGTDEDKFKKQRGDL